ncbi:hypothetical protein S40293_10745 [Stachybotrys chartarum IBT 40293]|nr:hypothetical protein S40293_10745 [Stachybotrys chartarum IBT 40293]
MCPGRDLCTGSERIAARGGVAAWASCVSSTGPKASEAPPRSPTRLQPLVPMPLDRAAGQSAPVNVSEADASATPPGGHIGHDAVVERPKGGGDP